jgi:hypothetical protein
MDAGAKLSVNPTVVAKAMPEGAVLIDSRTGECFELNRVGARVWDGLERGVDLAGLVDELAAEYAIDRARISTDVATLVDALTRHGVLIASSR